MIVYLDGLERNGNVYLSYVLSRSLNINLVSLRTHSLGTLEMYANKEYPFIIPVRDALPALVSAKIFRDYVHDKDIFNTHKYDQISFTADIIVDNFKQYYLFLENNPQFFIAPFYDFTTNHYRVLEKLHKFYNNDKLKLYRSVSSEEILSDIKKNNESEWAIHPELGNFPRKESELKKNTEEMFLNKYKNDINFIQNKINILYDRYERI